MRGYMPEAVRWSLITAVAPIVWGTTYLVTVLLLPPSSPFWSSFLRTFPAAIIGFLFIRQLPKGWWIFRSAVLSLLNIGFFFPLLFIAAYRLPGGIAAILSSFQPFFVMMIAWAVLRQSPTLQKVFFGCLAIAGVGLMVLTASARLDVVGVICGSFAILSMSLGIVLSRVWIRPVDGFKWTVWLLGWSSFFLFPVAFVFEGRPPSLDLAAILGYGWLSIVGALLAYSFWFVGLQRLSPVSASFLPLLSPITATVLGMVFLGETLNLAQWFGFVLCLSSIVCSQLDFGFRSQSRRNDV